MHDTEKYQVGSCFICLRAARIERATKRLSLAAARAQEKIKANFSKCTFWFQGKEIKPLNRNSF